MPRFFLWLSTHFCSLQQPMRETVGNKNKKRVFWHTCCKKRTHCKREYIANAMEDIFLYFLVANWGWLKCSSDDSHLCSRNHQLGSLFAVDAPGTMPKVKWTDSLYWDSQLISFLALIHEQMLMTMPFKLQSAIKRMQVGAKLSSFAVKHFSKILVALYYHQKNTILPLNCAPIKGLQVHWWWKLDCPQSLARSTWNGVTMRRRPLSVWKGAAKTPATDDEDGEYVDDENDQATEG